MPDYDLGRAHGRIVIDSDARGPAQAQRQMDQVRARAQELKRAMESVEKSMEEYEKSVTSSASASAKAESDHKRLAAATALSSARAKAAAISFTGQAQEAYRMARAVQEASVHVRVLAKTMGYFRSGGTNRILSGTIDDFRQLGATLRVVRDGILRVGESIAAATVAANGLVKVGSRIGTALRATAAFGLIAPMVARAGQSIRGLVYSAALVSPAFARASSAIGRLGVATGAAGAGVLRFGKNLAGVFTNMSLMIVGGQMVVNAFQGIVRASRLISAAAAGVSLLTGAVRALGTVALGAWDALKQLSGIVALLPGALMSIGIAGGVAMAGFKGIVAAFQAGYAPMENYQAMLEALSPEMRKVAESVREIQPELKGLKDLAEQSVLAGFGQDIQELGRAYIPILKRGVLDVGTALAELRTQATNFFRTQEGQEGVQRSFDLSAQMINNLARGIQPLIQALMDLWIVGQEAMADLTLGFDGAMQSFAAFMREARESGSLREWIDDSIQGIVDLSKAISQFSQGVGKIFRTFGSDGDNALARMAASAERFNKAVTASADGGRLGVMADQMTRMADTTFEVLNTTFNELLNILASAGPMVEAISNGFVTGFTMAVEVVGAVTKVVAELLSRFPAIGEAVGLVASLVVAFNLLKIAITPITAIIKALVGSFLFIKGAISSVMALNATLSATAGAGSRAAAGVAAFRAAVSGAAIAAGAFMASIGLIIGAMYSLRQNYKDNQKLNELLAIKQEAATKATRDFTAAFTEANGVLAENVIDEATRQVANLRDELAQTAEEGSGTFSDIAAFMKDSLSFNGLKSVIPGVDAGPRLNAQQASELDHIGQAAERAKEALKGLSDEDISGAITGTPAEWSSFANALTETGQAGQDALAALSPLRQGFEAAQAAMASIGPGGVQLAEAIRVIGDEGSSSAQKLDALKSALSALGLIQTTASEAAFEYQESLRQMGNNAQAAVDANAALGDALLLQNGQLDASQQNAYNLNQALSQLADKFLDAALKGGDAGQMYTDMQPALQTLANSFGLPVEKIQELISQMGVVPDVVDVLVSLQGQDAVQQDLAQILIQAGRVNGTPITVSVQSQAAVDALQALGAQVSNYDGTTKTATITMDPAQAMAALAQIQAAAQQPIPAPPVDTPVTPNPEPPAEGFTTPLPAPPVETPVTPNPIPPLEGFTTPLPAPPVQTPVTPNPTPPLQPLPSIPAPAVDTPVVPPVQMPPAPPPISVSINGVDGVVGGIGQINEALSNSAGKWNEYSAAISSAMSAAQGAVDSAASAISAALDGVAGRAYNSGSSLGQGFADGISSKIGAVQAAAAALAEAAAAPLPSSPAKIGPFSGRGWTPFRGAALSLGFAQGIRQNAPKAMEAAMDMATQIASAMDAVRTAFGWQATGFEANRAPGASGKRFYRDPDVSDEDIAKRRAERLEEEAKQRRDDDFREKKQKRIEDRREAREEAERAAEDAEKKEEDRLKRIEEGKDPEPEKDEEPKEKDDRELRREEEERAAEEREAMRELTLAQKETADAIIDQGRAAGASDEQIAQAIARSLKESDLTNAEIGANTIRAIQEGQGEPLPAGDEDNDADKALLRAALITADRTEAQDGTLDAIKGVLEEGSDPEEDSLKELRKQNKALDQSIKVAESPTSSDEDVIRALQDIEDAAASTEDPDVRDALQQISQNTQSDRGIKEYDPYEGASEDPVADVLKIIQNIFGIISQIESGLNAMTAIAAQLSRGFQNTAEVEAFVDNIQSVMSTAGSLVSTFADIVSTVGSLAAAIGMAIPGIGQIAAIAGQISGGIGMINQVIDLVQEGISLVGRFVGTALSFLAGGADGALMGDVKFLLDTNDGTLKAWSSDNPDDKRVHKLPGYNSDGNTTNNNGPQQLNVYAGPGQDPRETMQDAMFAVRAANTGTGAFN